MFAAGGIGMSAQPKAQARLSPEDMVELKLFLDGCVQAKLGSATHKFSADDRDFLIWMTGFTAGANLERDGERGERIFARCRELRDKICESQNPNPS
jgi:hypothetical protein